jgi:hypothetical protein
MRWFLTSIVAVIVAIGIYVGSAIVSLNGLVGAEGNFITQLSLSISSRAVLEYQRSARGRS